jgi:CRISPR/Cas system-associated endonuclease Cas3-HD
MIYVLIVFDEMEKQLDKIKPLNNDDINQTTQIITNNSSQSTRTKADIRKPLNKQPEVNKTLQDLIGQPIIFSKAVEPPRLQNSMKKGSAIGTLNERSLISTPFPA